MTYAITHTLKRLTFMQELFNELAAIAREEVESDDAFLRGLAQGRRIAYELAERQAEIEISGFNSIAALEEK